MEDCFEDRKTVKKHTNISCTVVQMGVTDEFYLQAAEASVRYKPCLIPPEFRVDKMKVICSGLEKEIYPNERWPGTPFAISEIKLAK